VIKRGTWESLRARRPASPWCPPERRALRPTNTTPGTHHEHRPFAHAAKPGAPEWVELRCYAADFTVNALLNDNTTKIIQNPEGAFVGRHRPNGIGAACQSQRAAFKQA